MHWCVHVYLDKCILKENTLRQELFVPKEDPWKIKFCEGHCEEPVSACLAEILPQNLLRDSMVQNSQRLGSETSLLPYT